MTTSLSLIALTIDPSGIIVQVLQQIVKTKMFSRPHNIAAREVATAALEWCTNPSSHEMLNCFEAHLIKLLECCIDPRPLEKIQRIMWGQYHKIRTTTEFRKIWKDFFGQAGIAMDPSPLLYQKITDVLFERVILNNCPISSDLSSTSQHDHEHVITYKESNALRYAAGYIPRALHKRLKHSSHPLKEELICCIDDLLENDYDDDEESEDWIDLVDRGGLVHISNSMYSFMVEMEKEVQNHLIKPIDNIKKSIKEGMYKNSEIRCRWSEISEDWDEEESKVLFEMIVDLWITIRGFAFASSWVEKYKMASKKSTQKTKGIRKKLCATKATKDPQ